MKNLPILISSLMMVCIFACNAEEPKLPDFSKTFPKEKFIKQSVEKGRGDYLYATDLSYFDLEKALLKFLGEGWSKVKIDRKTDDQTDPKTERPDRLLEGYRLFTNPKHPSVVIYLGLMPAPNQGKKGTAHLWVTKKSAQQDGADQPATALESKAK